VSPVRRSAARGGAAIVTALAAAAALALGYGRRAPPRAPAPAPTAAVSAPRVMGNEDGLTPTPDELGPDVVAGASDGAGAPKGAWRRYPLPAWCVRESQLCTTDEGAPGLRCGRDQTCFNPCPPGMGPEKRGLFCSPLCRSSAQCPGGTCTPEGVCDRWPSFDACPKEYTSCELPQGRMGRTCGGKCVNPCKKGLFLLAATSCVKACSSDADCPGGGCWTGTGTPSFCGPLCPSEGCPYLWE
jgi:hypothetical protein